MANRIPACLWCDAPLNHHGGPGRPRKFCRRAHRQRYHQAQMFDSFITPAILAREHGIECNVCGADVDLRAEGDLGPSMDHDIPRSQGGAHTLENVRLAHLRCNSTKGARYGFTMPPITDRSVEPDLTLF